MKLTRLELNNFCQHEYLLWEIPKGLIGILGANGSGKSNIIRSIVYAITGLGTNRKQGLRQGASIGSVTLDFRTDTDMQDYRVCRELHTTKVELFQKVQNQWTVIASGSERVKAFFQEQLEMDTDVIRTILAVPQEDLVMFFHEVPSRRMEVLNRLFGLAFIANRRELARKCRESAKKSFAAISASMEQVQAELSRQRTIYEHASKILKETPVQPIDDLIAQRDAISEQLKMCALQRFVHQEMNKCRDKLCTWKEELSRCHVPEKPDQIDNEAELIQKYNDTTHVYNQYQQILALIKNVVTLEKSRPVCVTDTDINECYAHLVELESQKAVVHYREAALHYDTCPICGTDLKNIQLDNKQIAEQLQSIEQESNHARVQFEKLRAAKRKYDEWTAQITQEIDRIRQLDPKQTLLVGTTIFSDEAMKVEKNLYDTILYLKKNKALLDTFEQYHTNLAAYERQTSLLRLRISDEEARLATFQPTDPLACDESKLQQEFEQLNHRIQQQYALLEPQTNLKSSSEAITRLEQELITWKEKVVQVQNSEVLDSVLALLQPNQLPVYIMKQLMFHLMELMNRYLIACGSSYTVSLSDDSDIICNKQTISQPVSRLSGGEKMLLAIAFRLAVHDAFSTSDTGGFIVLDEPTTFLDDTNKECLTVALTNLLRSGTCNNKQIFVITHDLALLPLFESSLMLN